MSCRSVGLEAGWFRSIWRRFSEPRYESLDKVVADAMSYQVAREAALGRLREGLPPPPTSRARDPFDALLTIARPEEAAEHLEARHRAIWPGATPARCRTPSARTRS